MLVLLLLAGAASAPLVVSTLRVEAFDVAHGLFWVLELGWRAVALWR